MSLDYYLWMNSDFRESRVPNKRQTSRTDRTTFKQHDRYCFAGLRRLSYIVILNPKPYSIPDSTSKWRCSERWLLVHRYPAFRMSIHQVWRCSIGRLSEYIPMRYNRDHCDKLDQNFTLMTVFPRKEYAGEDLKMTLAAACKLPSLFPFSISPFFALTKKKL